MSKFKLSAKDKAVIEDLYVEFVSEHTDMSLFYSSEIGNDILTELLLERGIVLQTLMKKGTTHYGELLNIWFSKIWCLMRTLSMFLPC